ncbi:acyl-CoA dehydrogenase family protein [Actinoplanes sp. GCM10030250]|uniref:acyl-CoA dehydrogenase family protein n=1 Tax=Actinoplanes sp. GCM10030250 TaxID=3273376 RepID=UPI003607A76A
MRAGLDVIDTAPQVLGARGFLDTNTVGQHSRDHRLFQMFEGSTKAITVHLGTALIRHPGESTKLVRQTQSTAQALRLIDQSRRSAPIARMTPPPGTSTRPSSASWCSPWYSPR